MADALAGGLLRRANRARRNPASAGPLDLWRLASESAPGNRAERGLRFRHAMLHAGYHLDERGKPYLVCPTCGRILA